LKISHLALAVIVASAMNLSACSKPDAPAKPSDAPAAARPAKPSDAPAAARPAQPYEAVATGGKGFSVGAMMSANPVYVMFDPQCPHCGELWEAARPLQSKVKFVWMPVSIIGSKSIKQGAALLAASNPAEAMAAHEKSILAGTGGMAVPASVPAELEDAVKKNTALFSSLGVDSVPYILAKNLNTGSVVTNTGSMTTGELAAFLGVSLP
jgi:thiol:disulfide interchange protein DsbG